MANDRWNSVELTPQSVVSFENRAMNYIKHCRVIEVRQVQHRIFAADYYSLYDTIKARKGYISDLGTDGFYVQLDDAGIDQVFGLNVNDLEFLKQIVG